MRLDPPTSGNPWPEPHREPEFTAPGWPPPRPFSSPVPEFTPPGWTPPRPPDITPPGWRPQPRPVHRPPVPSVPFDPPPPGDDVFTRLLEHRIVLVTGQLDAKTMSDAAAQLMLLDATGDQPIELRLMCPGGDLDAAAALADTIDLLGVELRACATGVLGGPALGPFVACNQRVAHAHATFVLRDPDLSVTGRAEDFVLAVASYERQLADLHRRLAAACGQTLARIGDDMEHGLILSAEGARDYGLVDEVILGRR